MCSIKIISEYSGVPINELMGTSHKLSICLNRFICWKCMYETKKMTYDEIASVFNRKSHSTIISGIKTYSNMISNNDKKAQSQLHNHSCYKQFVLETPAATIIEKLIDIEQIYENTNFSIHNLKEFENIVRLRNIQLVRNSVQRTTKK